MVKMITKDSRVLTDFINRHKDEGRVEIVTLDDGRFEATVEADENA